MTMADILRKGLIAEGGTLHGDGDKAAEGAIPFGVGVQLGTAATQVKKYAGGTFWGVAVRDEAITGLDGSGNVVALPYYPDGYPVSVLRKGPIVVEVEEAVAVGDPVYCNDTTANFQKSATGAHEVPGAVFKTAAAADGDLAIIELNLP